MVRIDARPTAATAASLGLGTTDTPEFSAVKLGGLTPATVIRFVGKNPSSGAPASGTFVTGDVMVDVNGVLWLCTAGGTPGTWGYAVPSHGQVHGPGGSDPAVVALPATKTGDQTNATTTQADITDLGLAVPASGTYDFYYLLHYGSNNASNGIALQLKSSGAPTTSALAYAIRIQNTTTTHNTWGNLTTFAAAQTTGTVGNTGSFYCSEIWGRLTATGAGTLIPQFAIGSGSASTATMKAGSTGRLSKVAV